MRIGRFTPLVNCRPILVAACTLSLAVLFLVPIDAGASQGCPGPFCDERPPVVVDACPDEALNPGIQENQDLCARAPAPSPDPAPEVAPAQPPVMPERPADPALMAPARDEPSMLGDMAADETPEGDAFETEFAAAPAATGGGAPEAAGAELPFTGAPGWLLAAAGFLAFVALVSGIALHTASKSVRAD